MGKTFEELFGDLTGSATRKAEEGQTEEATKYLNEAINLRDAHFTEIVIQPRSNEWYEWNAAQKAIDGVKEAIHKALNA